MPRDINPVEIKPGDHVYFYLLSTSSLEYLAAPTATHHGIVVETTLPKTTENKPRREVLERIMVVHLTRNSGLVRTTLLEFLGDPDTTVRKVRYGANEWWQQLLISGTNCPDQCQPAEVVVANAESAFNHKEKWTWDWNFNCEAFAKFCTTHVPTSEQQEFAERAVSTAAAAVLKTAGHLAGSLGTAAVLRGGAAAASAAMTDGVAVASSQAVLGAAVGMGAGVVLLSTGSLMWQLWKLKYDPKYLLPHFIKDVKATGCMSLGALIGGGLGLLCGPAAPVVVPLLTGVGAIIGAVIAHVVFDSPDARTLHYRVARLRLNATDNEKRKAIRRLKQKLLTPELKAVFYNTGDAKKNAKDKVRVLQLLAAIAFLRDELHGVADQDQAPQTSHLIQDIFQPT
eukprot:TRINITY_DN67605_c2_g1_i2.p1 TRINITY_DN67605_c2_g1~~TRINITY_DN67605_c2_g1_i2.p1  ORF type:complete len:409 (-),score=21.63 TRINITY_DN67605_c2_g1_i2:79-1272(-)